MAGCGSGIGAPSVEPKFPLPSIRKAVYKPAAAGGAATLPLVMKEPALRQTTSPTATPGTRPKKYRSFGPMEAPSKPDAIWFIFPGTGMPLTVKVMLLLPKSTVGNQVIAGSEPRTLPTFSNTKYGPWSGPEGSGGISLVTVNTSGSASVSMKGDPLPPEKLKVAWPRAQPRDNVSRPAVARSAFLIAALLAVTMPVRRNVGISCRQA